MVVLVLVFLFIIFGIIIGSVGCGGEWSIGGGELTTVQG